MELYKLEPGTVIIIKGEEFIFEKCDGMYAVLKHVENGQYVYIICSFKNFLIERGDKNEN